MLMPHERNQAIEVITNYYAANLSQLHNHNGNPTKSLLLNGHKGFASYSDYELMRTMQSLVKVSNNHEIVSFVKDISAARFMLGSE